MKIDKRKNYYLTIDVETAGSLEEPLVYDIGGAIHDKSGKVYETFSFIIYEVYAGMRELMQSAYYANKLPEYEVDLESQHREMVRWDTVRKHIFYLNKMYNLKAIIAYNMRFDSSAIKNTTKVLTNGKYRTILPYGVPIWCSFTMAKQVIVKQKTFQKWAEKNNKKTANGRISATAETVYQYLSNQDHFEEEHKGLEDVLIEVEIFARAIAQKKKMRKTHYIPKF